MMDRLWAPWRLEYIQGPEDGCCIFCVDEDPAEDQSRLIVVRGEYSYVIMNRYPYSNGHLMVSPYRHVSDPADLENRCRPDIHMHFCTEQQAHF